MLRSHTAASWAKRLAKDQARWTERFGIFVAQGIDEKLQTSTERAAGTNIAGRFGAAPGAVIQPPVKVK